MSMIYFFQVKSKGNKVVVTRDPEGKSGEWLFADYVPVSKPVMQYVHKTFPTAKLSSTPYDPPSIGRRYNAGNNITDAMAISFKNKADLAFFLMLTANGVDLTAEGDYV